METSALAGLRPSAQFQKPTFEWVWELFEKIIFEKQKITIFGRANQIVIFIMANKQWRKSKTAELKPVFAAYLNMARHNFYRSLLHISQLMQIPETKEEEKMAEFSLWNKLNAGTPPEKLKIIKLLQRQFPIMQAAFDVEKKNDIGITTNSKEIKRILLTFISVLNGLRNEYTHYSPDSRNVANDSIIIPYLYRCMDGAAREVKNRFVLTVNAPQTKEQASHITDVNKAVEYIFQGIFRKIKVNDNVNKGKNKTKVIDKKDYFYSLKDTIEIEKLNKEGKSIKEQRDVLSDIGIVFFICQFLEKRYAAMFLDAIKPWPQEFDGTEKKAVLEVFSVFHIRPPKEKYDSQRPEYALGLDMLNELQKCPTELFDVLSDKARDMLSVDIHAQGEDVVQDDGVTVKNGKVQMKRIRDRFAPLALQYIDRKEVFDDIRFMVHLGNYRFKFYKKQCLADNGPDTLRILQKEINGFGKIHDVEIERKRKYSALFKKTRTTTDENESKTKIQEQVADTPDSKPYMTDTKAHYLFSNNRVGLRLFNDSSKLDIPEVTKQGLPLTSASEVKLLLPDAWLSIYELPGLIFYQHLHKEYGAKGNYPSAEDILKSYIGAYKRLFSDIKEGTFQGWDDTKYKPLSQEVLPIKIKKYIQNGNGVQSAYFHKKARERIKEMCKQTQAELTGFKSKISKMTAKDNKFKKGHYIDLRPGSISMRLCRDILFFMEIPEEKSVITSANFNSLQSALAMSATTMAKVDEMLSPLKHPFLQEALKRYHNLSKDKCFKVFDFYRIYLEERADYLESIKKISSEQLIKLPFLHYSRIRWRDRNNSSIKELAGRYEQFELPRSLFTQYAKKILVENCSLSLEAETAERKLGMSNLVNDYFKTVMNDATQKFYRWPRHYKVFDLLGGNTIRNQVVHNFMVPNQLQKMMHDRKNLEPNKLMCDKAKNAIKQKKGNDGLTENELAKQILHKAYKEYDENERIIRRYAVQDTLMFLMAKDILLGIDGIEKESLDKFKLKDILPNNNETILELMVPFNVSLIVNGTNVTIRQEEKIKIKRFGEFYRYNSDTRLKSLIPYLVKNLGTGVGVSIEIDRDKLETELSQYDLNRIEVMKQVQSLEQSIIASAGGKNNIDKTLRENFNNLITVQGNIPYENQGRILINVRNAFCHNEYAKDIDIPANTPLPQVADTIVKLFETEKRRKHKDN